MYASSPKKKVKAELDFYHKPQRCSLTSFLREDRERERETHTQRDREKRGERGSVAREGRESEDYQWPTRAPRVRAYATRERRQHASNRDGWMIVTVE